MTLMYKFSLNFKFPNCSHFCWHIQQKVVTAYISPIIKRNQTLCKTRIAAFLHEDQWNKPKRLMFQDLIRTSSVEPNQYQNSEDVLLEYRRLKNTILWTWQGRRCLSLNYNLVSGNMQRLITSDRYISPNHRAPLMQACCPSTSVWMSKRYNGVGKVKTVRPLWEVWSTVFSLHSFSVGIADCHF